MREKFHGKLKIIIIFAALFLVIATLLLLIFNAGKKTYTVRFDLDGGTLLRGSRVQSVIHGQDAVPPEVVKEGAFLRGWSVSYKRITKDVVIEAVWEYDTTPGILYTDSEFQNYTEIVGAVKYLQGEVYIGAYYEEKKVLSILDGAFADCTGITKVYLLDGLLLICDNAFAGCASLEEIEIPETVFSIGEGAFAGCESLETLVLNEGLKELGANAFAGCTALETVVLPESLETIGADAFAGCDNLIIKVQISKDEVPEGWAEGWSGNATVEWGFEAPEPEPEEDMEADEEMIV